MILQSAATFPLSAHSRIAVGLQILKCVLIPFVPDRLKDAGIDPLSLLPESSPVLKQGFELDARAALKMMSECRSLFFERPDALMALIKPLSRQRDQWAHQQQLSHGDAMKFLKTASTFCKELSFAPEALACHTLCSPPADIDLSWLVERWDHERPATISELEKSLFLSNGVTGHTELQSALIWAAAIELITGMPTDSGFFKLDAVSADNPQDVGLPIRSLWWLYGHSHKAPIEIRRAAYLDHTNSLDQGASDF